MKLKLRPPLRSIINDSLSFYSPEYYCLINWNSAYFFRTVGKRTLDILISINGETSAPDFLEQFFSQMTSHEKYYGQPVTMLLNNSKAFSYLVILKKQKATQVLEKIRLIQSDEICFTNTIRTDTNHPIFVGQGIDNPYLSQIESLAQRYNVMLLSIETLPVFLILNLPSRTFIESEIVLFQFYKGDCFYLLWDKQENLVFSSLANHLNHQQELENVKNSFFGFDSTKRMFMYKSDKIKGLTNVNCLSINKLLNTGFKSTSNQRKHLVKPDTATLSKIVKTTMNSLRLLSYTMVGICLLCLAAAGITGIISARGSDVTLEFQTYYSQNLTLELELENLLSLDKKLSRQLPKKLPAAEIVSSFCQRQQRGVYLSQIFIDNSRADSLHLEVKGVSEKEPSVFLYHQKLMDLLHPINLSMIYLKSEIRNSRGIVDTVFVFDFGASINESTSN